MGGPIIAAITAGSFFGLLLIGAAAYFLCCKSGEKTQSYKPNDKGGVDDEGESSAMSHNQTVSVKNTTGSPDHVHHMVASTLTNEGEDEKKYFI